MYKLSANLILLMEIEEKAQLPVFSGLNQLAKVDAV